MKKVLLLMTVIMMVPFFSSCTTYVRPGPPRPVVYAAPPYPGAVWVAGYYGPYGGWHPGHWR